MGSQPPPIVSGLSAGIHHPSEVKVGFWSLMDLSQSLLAKETHASQGLLLFAAFKASIEPRYPICSYHAAFSLFLTWEASHPAYHKALP